MQELPPLLTASDLAKLLGLTEHGARALLRRGELPAVRIGRKWFVRREALENHIRRQEARQRKRAELVESVLKSLPRLRG